MLKDLLRRTLGKSSSTYEELYTVLCDCESALNARPLTYVSSDSEDLIPLSPSLFMQDISNNEILDIDEMEKISISRRWRYIQKMREDLRARFKKEYLGMLVNHGHFKKSDIKKGDVVLIGSDNVKRVSWPLGLVVETFPGKDGITRLVRLKTATGELTRPVQRLYPLEMNCVQVQDVVKSQDVPLLVPQEKRGVDERVPVKTRIGREIK